MRHIRLARALLVALSVPAGGLLADATWTIPGIVNANGLNGTHFVSDLTVTNPGTAAAHVTLSFFPVGSSSSRNLTLNPGQTVVHADVAGVTFGISGQAGALAISSDQPLLIRAKTYNTAASGTYGVSLPVIASDRLLAAGDVGDSLWITQDASGSSGYRTNLAMVFPDEEGGEAAVTVFDADGHEVGRKDFSLDAPGLQQFAVGSFAGAVPVGRAQVQVLRGRAAGYSVVVDNVTGDSSLFAFEQLPAGWQDVLVNGVARANGRNGTFFRTDGRFYNPASEDARVTVAFHANQSDNSSAVTRDFTIAAGKILDVVDVLDSLLGLPVGSSGALRFHAESPVAILCRTSNVDPSGTKPGTFGAQQRPTPLLSFLMSGDAGAVVTGIRQNATFRTNVGFAAGADGAAYTLTLKTAAGATVATGAGSLGVFGWTQPSIQDLFPGVTIPDDARLLVKVTSGSVDVYDSSIDNASGDPVVTPIAAVPATIPSSATIGPQGGSIRSDDGALTLRIPAGALGAPTQFSIATVTNDAPGALGPAYDVSPGGLALAKPALLSLRYGVAGVPADGIDGVSLAVLEGSVWVGLTGGRIDTTARSLAVPIRNTSPSSALSTTRTAQAQGGSTRVGSVGGIEVLSLTGGWVPTGGKLPLQVVFRLPPTSTRDQVRFVPVGEQPGTSVTWSKPSAGTFSSLNNSTTTYTAPESIENATSKVRFSVKVSNSTTGEVDPYPFSLNVIRRRWALTLGIGVDLECVGSNKDFSASYISSADQVFRFNDDLTLVADGPTTQGPPHPPTVASCDAACQPTVVAAPGDLQLTVVAGNFLRENGFLLAGTASVPNAIPTVRLKCVPESASRTAFGADYVQQLPGYFPLSNVEQHSPPKLPGVPLWISGTWQSVRVR